MDNIEVTDVGDGVIIFGSYPVRAVLEEITKRAGSLPLIIADPPYGNILPSSWDRVLTSDDDFCDWMLAWTNLSAGLLLPGGALYVWGGIGRPRFRPFYKYLASVETKSPFSLSTHITWSKKRAYGIQWGYLFTREELAYLVFGDPKKPRCFHIPLLETKRSYAGYNKDYPALSEFYRRTNVWTDVVEILKGKKHEAQKPDRLHEIMIETHTEPGEWVLDPFAGSGTTGRAARKLGRRFILVENDRETYEKCVREFSASSTDQSTSTPQNSLEPSPHSPDEG